MKTKGDYFFGILFVAFLLAILFLSGCQTEIKIDTPPTRNCRVEYLEGFRCVVCYNSDGFVDITCN